MGSFYGNHGSIGSGDGLPSVQPTDEGKALIVQNGEWVPGIVDADGLPNVTANDNGKVLTVIDGQWNVAEFSNTSRELYWQTTPDIDWQNVSQSSESVTAQVEVGSGLIPNDTYIITYDGQEYTLTAQELVPGICLLGEIDDDNGGPSFENYPFIISGGANTDNTVVSIGAKDSNPPADFKIEHIINTSGLPEVTNNDNGKVLTVVDGKWVAFGSENHQILYNQTIDNWIWSPEENLTWQQLVLRDDSNIVPGNTYLVTVDGVEYTLTATEDSDYPGKIDLINESGELPFEIIVHQNSNNPTLFLQGDHREDSIDVKIEYIETKSPLLPEVADNDNGKVLTVVNGEWGVAESAQFPNPENDGDMLVGIDGEWTPINMLDIQEKSTVLLDYPNKTYEEAMNSVPKYTENTTTVNFGNILEDYIGQTVIVSYDNTDYECTVYATPNKAQYEIGSGVGTNTTPDFEDFPFKFIAVNIFGNTWGLNIDAESAGTHDVTIRAVDETKTIKPEYLPYIDSNSCNCPELPKPSESIFNVSFDSNDITSQGTPGGTFYYNATQLDTSSYLLVPGDQYVVTFNGIDYVITANNDFVDHAYLGKRNDNGLGYDYEAYPFFIYEDSNHMLYVYVPEEESGIVDIKHILLEDDKILVTKDGKWIAINPNGEEKRDVIFEDTVSEYGYNGIAMIEIATYDPGTQPEDVDFLFTSGETYIVTFDGVEYELTAKDLNNVIGGCELGERSSNNGAVIFENYPFFIEDDYQQYDGHLRLYITANDPTTSHDIKIEHVTQIDPICNCLPEVTNTDNRKILQVVNGEWVAAYDPEDIANRELLYDASAGSWTPYTQDGSTIQNKTISPVSSDTKIIPGETYLVTIDGVEYLVTASHDDIAFVKDYLGEYDNHMSVYDTYPFNIGTGWYSGSDQLYINFKGDTPPSEIKIEHIIESQSLPTVDEDDEGDILRVINGEWTVVNPDGEENRETIFEDTVSEYNAYGEANIIRKTYPRDTPLEDIDFLLTLNEPYIVTFDGVEYEINAKEDSDLHRIYLGEKDHGTNTFQNYPFHILDQYMSYDGVLSFSISVEDPTTSHDIKIEHINRIDPICNCLPNVTKVDNNKILTVVNGEWVAAYDQEDIANRELFYDASKSSWTSLENGWYMSLLTSDLKIIPGETYVITVNDKEYVITAKHDDKLYYSEYLGEIDEYGQFTYDTYPFYIGEKLNYAGDLAELQIEFKNETPPTKFKIERLVDTSTLNCLYENILDEEYSSWSETESGQWHVNFSSSVNHAFASGEKYLVTYDDIQYITTAYDIETKDQYVKACQLGNINNGDPMELKWYDSAYGGGHYEIIIPENNGSHKINIKHIIDADISRKVIYDKTISNWNIQENRIGYSESNLEQPLALISGELYIVTIDETEYIVRANADNQQQEYIDIKDILIGDPNVFIIATNRSSYNTSYENGIVIYTNDSSSHHIKIERLISKAKIFAPENDGDMLVGIDGEWTSINIMDIETESTVLLDYQNGTYDLSINGDYPTYAPDPITDDIEAILKDYVGETVIVSYDGIDYECPVYSTSAYYMIGNNAEYSINHLADINPGNFEEYPFLFLAVNYDNNWGVNIYSANDGTHDVTIRTVDETTTVIKSEYLPCQYIEDGTGDYAVIINGVDTLPSTGGYDPGTPKNIASGDWAIAEGKATEASGTSSHAEGERTVASGYASHAEGYTTLATGGNSHAEGSSTKAYGHDSHVEGIGTETGMSTSAVAGSAAHAEGRGTKAIAEASHAEGEGTIANGRYQHVGGKYNIADSGTEAHVWNGTYVEIIGNGTSDSNRSNARTLDWNGNEVLAGKLTVGAVPTADMDVATKKYVDDSIADAQSIAEVTITTAGAVSQALDAGKIYHFTGAVSSLSLTLNAAANGQLAQYHFDFTSGSTATTVIINGVTWIGGSFVPEASKRYEVDILNGYGVYLSW